MLKATRTTTATLTIREMACKVSGDQNNNNNNVQQSAPKVVFSCACFIASHFGITIRVGNFSMTRGDFHFLCYFILFYFSLTTKLFASQPEAQVEEL